MKFFDELYNNGIKVVNRSTVVFCGMVRDCEQDLKKNIPVIEKLGSLFKDYSVVVFENNSVDGTKDVLVNWKRNNRRVAAIINDFDESKYKEIPKEDCYFLPNSRRRIQKYVDYRNLYMEYLDNNNIIADYVILIDLDIAKIDIKGVVTSFGTKLSWDVITANGYSLSPYLRRRYHDTYALCESGHEEKPQTIPEILDYRVIFSHLKKGMPFIRVFSAYGGLAIFKRNILQGIRYSIMDNLYSGVEVHCEHFSLYKKLAEKGYDKVYINPNMEVYYQRLSFNLFFKKIKDLLHGYK